VTVTLKIPIKCVGRGIWMAKKIVDLRSANKSSHKKVSIIMLFIYLLLKMYLCIDCLFPNTFSKIFSGKSNNVYVCI